MLTFTVRAVFWTAVVAAFVPAGFGAQNDGAFAREARAVLEAPARETAEAARAETGRFCQSEGQFCTILRELGGFVGLVGGVAATRAEEALEARLSVVVEDPAEANALDSLIADRLDETPAR
jgi:hypothetical protein